MGQNAEDMAQAFIHLESAGVKPITPCCCRVNLFTLELDFCQCCFSATDDRRLSINHLEYTQQRFANNFAYLRLKIID